MFHCVAEYPAAYSDYVMILYLRPPIHLAGISAAIPCKSVAVAPEVRHHEVAI